MKTIRFSPAKLDRYADEYFHAAEQVEFDDAKNSRHESLTLAGLALRIWAIKMRESNKRAKVKRARAK